MTSYPPYWICQIVELLKFRHDWINLQDMSAFVEVLSTMMGVRAHLHLFCSALPSKIWYELLVGEVGDIVKEKDLMECEEMRNQRSLVLVVEAKASNCS